MRTSSANPGWRWAALALCACATVPVNSRPHAAAEIEAFNQALRSATLRMDTPALVALWEDDGVSLLPGEQPLVGKQAVASFIEAAVRSMPGSTMTSFELHCAHLEVSGDWASETCDEHQVVDLGSGKPPFDGRGRLLFVLHRGPDATWRIRREMWSQGAKP